MNVQGIIEIQRQWNGLKERALEAANAYDNLKHPGRASFEISPFDKLESINHNETFTCSYRHNVECHCHPRYKTFKLTLPLSLLETVDPVYVWEDGTPMSKEDSQEFGWQAEEKANAETKVIFDERLKQAFEAKAGKYEGEE
jgi:hypothetical protein